MLKAFDSCYILPSRKTFSSVLIPRLYNDVKEQNILPNLEHAHAMALTTDLWTSHAADQYIWLTVHFIDKDWSMECFTLKNQELPPPHDFGIIAQTLKDMQEWKIMRNWVLWWLTMQQMWPKHCMMWFFYQMYHVLVIPWTWLWKLVKNRWDQNHPCPMLKISGIQYVHRSAKAKYSLKAHPKLLDIFPHKLIQVVDTRWGSTHDMIKRILMSME